MQVAATSLAATVFTAVPAQAGLMDWLRRQACEVGCDVDWFADLQSCGIAYDFLLAGCVMQIPVHTPQESVDCFNYCGDFQNECISITNWDSYLCEQECA